MPGGLWSPSFQEASGLLVFSKHYLCAVVQRRPPVSFFFTAGAQEAFLGLLTSRILIFFLDFFLPGGH